MLGVHEDRILSLMSSARLRVEASILSMSPENYGRY